MSDISLNSFPRSSLSCLVQIACRLVVPYHLEMLKGREGGKREAAPSSHICGGNRALARVLLVSFGEKKVPED